jgi:hypothetical protein
MLLCYILCYAGRQAQCRRRADSLRTETSSTFSVVQVVVAERNCLKGSCCRRAEMYDQFRNGLGKVFSPPACASQSYPVN